MTNNELAAILQEMRRESAQFDRQFLEINKQQNELMARHDGLLSRIHEDNKKHHSVFAEILKAIQNTLDQLLRPDRN